jgi:hypothetical protein
VQRLHQLLAERARPLGRRRVPTKSRFREWD